MSTRRARVMAEREKLGILIRRLETFLYGGPPPMVASEELVDLKLQLTYMMLYFNVLNSRISRIPGEGG